MLARKLNSGHPVAVIVLATKCRHLCGNVSVTQRDLAKAAGHDFTFAFEPADKMKVSTNHHGDQSCQPTR
jgi:hypothetical protein